MKRVIKALNGGEYGSFYHIHNGVYGEYFETFEDFARPWFPADWGKIKAGVDYEVIDIAESVMRETKPCDKCGKMHKKYGNAVAAAQKHARHYCDECLDERSAEIDKSFMDDFKKLFGGKTNE